MEATIIISIILAAAVAAVIRKLVRDKKRGKSIGCGCGCASCPSGGACGGVTPKTSAKSLLLTFLRTGGDSHPMRGAKAWTSRRALFSGKTAVLSSAFNIKSWHL